MSGVERYLEDVDAARGQLQRVLDRLGEQRAHGNRAGLAYPLDAQLVVWRGRDVVEDFDPRHFEIVGGDSQGQRISVPYDMLHVSPPQSPPDDISSSPLANAAGWVEVDQNSMQHVRHANVFALGDVTATPNSKTAAAVRKQAPVVVRNILKLMNGQAIDGGYDGYASCPLTTANGKAIIAEFIYGGKVTPTLPILNPGKERWLGWWIKVSFLPIMYWQYMLKGYEWFPKHNTAFKEPTVG